MMPAESIDMLFCHFWKIISHDDDEHEDATVNPSQFPDFFPSERALHGPFTFSLPQPIKTFPLLGQNDRVSVSGTGNYKTAISVAHDPLNDVVFFIFISI